MADNWTDKQRQAIDTRGCNVLVAAAAGSGKTAVLVERIIRRITDETQPAEIDRLVVVTFTKAAAAEMKQRIRTAIDALLMEQPENEWLQRQLTLINNAQITTIDSFCLNIVRSYFTELDIDPGFRTADEGEIRLLEQDVMEEMLESYYASKDPVFYDFVDAYGTGRNDSGIVELILKIYRFARSYPWEQEWYDSCRKLYQVSDAQELDQNAAVQSIWADLMHRLSDYDCIYNQLEQICESPAGPNMYLAAIQSDHAAIRTMRSAKSFSELSERVRRVSFDTLGRSRDKELSEEKKEAVKTARSGYKDFINKQLKMKIFAKDPEKQVQDIQDNAVSIDMMMRLAADFSERMQAQKRVRNIIDFNDMEHMALDVLVRREGGACIYTEASDSLSNFYEEILIDEYQDSNLLQEAILTAVSKGKRDPSANNIYMVGDVKQSIYKFRLACPELFIRKYNTYTEDSGVAVKIELQTNFRSRANVLECTNDVFGRLMNPDFAGIEYDEKARLNPGFEYPDGPGTILCGQAAYKAEDFGNNPDTEIVLVETEDADVQEEQNSRELEAEAVADVIERLMGGSQEGKVQVVYDKNAAGGYRPIRYSDIVVLTRTVTGWAETFVNTLMNRGIPAYADAAEGYFNVREIQLILNYLAVIDNPLQDIPMAAVLLSYFGKLNTEELTQLVMTDRDGGLYEQIKKSPEKKLTAFREQLEHYRNRAELMSVQELLWEVIYDTGYYDYVGSMPAGQRRQANLDILLERAAAFENTSYKGLFNFLRYIERLKKFDVDFGEASILGENEDLVRIMSIHKSKGLEFPVVILAGLGKKFNQRDAAGEVVIDQQLGVGTNVVRLDKRTKNPTLIKTAVSRKLIREGISEEMRVLYVAMTRAREKLIMTGTVKKAEQTLLLWREQAAVLAERGLYLYSEAAACTTYFDMLMPAACLPETENKGKFEVRICARPVKAEQRGERAEEIGSGMEDKEKGHEKVPAGSEETAALGKERQESLPPYPYPLDAGKKAKVTVSELKKMQHEQDFDERKMVPEALSKLIEEEETVIPSFISGTQQELAGNERGTAYHRVMECLDYNSLSSLMSNEQTKQKEQVLHWVEEQLAQMLESRKLTGAQANCVAAADIAAFCLSATGKRVCMASLSGRLWREQPFVFMAEQTDGPLIQGVIDLYLIEDGQVTIVDYKTDHVQKGKAGEEELRRRYAVQLEYYAAALQQMTGLSVKDKVIYSFTLGREIDI